MDGLQGSWLGDHLWLLGCQLIDHGGLLADWLDGLLLGHQLLGNRLGDWL